MANPAAAPAAAATAPTAAVNGAAPPTPPAPPVGAGDATQAEAESWLTGRLAVQPVISKSDIVSEAFKDLTNNPNRSGICNLLYQDSFYTGLAAAGRILWDGSTVQRAGG
jgi:hypothetical protein